MNNGFILTARQSAQLDKAIERLWRESFKSPRSAKKDAEELKRFIHMLRALAWVSPNERNHYLAKIDEIFDTKHDDVLTGAIVQSLEEDK